MYDPNRLNVHTLLNAPKGWEGFWTTFQLKLNKSFEWKEMLCNLQIAVRTRRGSAVFEHWLRMSFPNKSGELNSTTAQQYCKLKRLENDKNEIPPRMKNLFSYHPLEAPTELSEDKMRTNKQRFKWWTKKATFSCLRQTFVWIFSDFVCTTEGALLHERY